MGWLEGIVSAASGAGLTGVAGAAFWWGFAKKALEEKLRIAAEQQIEKYKHELEKELEGQRQGANVALEQFKAELTLTAEVRRQFAAEKVKAVLAFVHAIDPLIKRLWYASEDVEVVVLPMQAQEALGKAAVYMDAGTVGEIGRLLGEAQKYKQEGDAVAKRDTLATVEIGKKMEKSLDRIVELVRQELGSSSLLPSFGLAKKD